jgi:predicted nucleic acid-binding protein
VSFLVDTDICSAYLKGDNRVHGRFVQYGGRVHISAITAGQLFTWALVAPPTTGRVQRLLQLLRDTTFLDVDRSVSEKFGDLRTQQIKLGQKTPDMDLLIAATAIVHNLAVVTHNQRHFVTVPGLTVLDWLAP